MKTCPLVVVLALLSPVPAQDLAWPGFRGPGRDGVARDASPPVEWSETENVTWKVDLPGAGASCPVVVDDKIILTCYTGYGRYEDDGGEPEALQQHLVCVACDDGEILWSTILPGKLDHDARQVQIQEHGFATPTPVTDGERIYAYMGPAGVFAFDFEGKVLWNADLGEPSPDAPPATNSVERGGQVLSLRWGTAASPVLHDGLVIVNASEESNAIQAFDAKTGELRWKRESADLEGSAISPAICEVDGGAVVVIALGGAIWGLEPRTGESLWEVTTETRGGMSPTPIAHQGTVYCFGGAGESYALRARLGEDEEEDARIVWKGPNLDIPSPVMHDGRLYLVDQSGFGQIVDVATGELLHKSRLDGRTGKVYASPVVADGRLYVTSREKGTFVYACDDELTLLARNELGDESEFNASPAIVGGTVYLRSDSTLYRIDES